MENHAAIVDGTTYGSRGNSHERGQRPYLNLMLLRERGGRKGEGGGGRGPEWQRGSKRGARGAREQKKAKNARPRESKTSRWSSNKSGSRYLIPMIK